jgi:hypothetical protein
VRAVLLYRDASSSFPVLSILLSLDFFCVGWIRLQCKIELMNKFETCSFVRSTRANFLRSNCHSPR